MSKNITIALAAIAVIILLGATCSAGFVAGQVIRPFGAASTVRALPGLSGVIGGASPQSATPRDARDLFAPFWQTWDLVHVQYVDQPVSDEKLMRGAIKGMLESLGDQHTSYMDPDQQKAMDARLNGQEYEGIGAFVDTTGTYLKIISPMPGSPAEKAGLKTNDLIVAVDGEDMAGKDGEYIRQHVIGPKGTTVTLTIRRSSIEKPFDVKVQRAAIITPTIENRLLDGQIGYIRLYSFGDKTGDDLKAALTELLAKKPVGLILDLRDNGGGFLKTGIEVSSQFVSSGVVMYEEFGDGNRKTYDAIAGGLAPNIPLIVLINQGSASASEIVAGAIRDRGRGKLVGVTSYGKGSVQLVTELNNNEGAVRITTAKWMTPSGKSINKQGLTPDVEVKMTPEDQDNNRDPQLQRAIDLLLGK
jgi:carboxyl-terminal processing protease